MDDGVTVKPGDLLAGKYRVEKILGRGAMGVVVAANQTALDRRVALKFMTRSGSHAGEHQERFAREARAAARLQSQHVAKVLDYGTLESGAPYIVMEYLEGQDLASLLDERGPMDVDKALTLILQACEGLAEAHAAGIVHRDIKPANLFVSRANDGSPCLKVVDFGVAKVQGGGLDLTASVMALGSPLYMSPEVMNGQAREVDGRADIWALGITLYEMLAGVRPFQRDTIEQLMKAVLLDPVPPLAEYRADVPAGLIAVIEQALEKKRDRRFPSVAAFVAALAPYAPPQAKPYVERVMKIQGADLMPSRPTDLLPSEPQPRSPPTSAPISGAAPASMTSEAASVPRATTLPSASGRTPPTVIGLVILVALLAIALVVVLVRGTGEATNKSALDAGPILSVATAAPEMPSALPVVVRPEPTPQAPSTASDKLDPGPTSRSSLPLSPGSTSPRSKGVQSPPALPPPPVTARGNPLEGPRR